MTFADGQPSLAHSWADQDSNRMSTLDEPREDRRVEWSITTSRVALIHRNENARGPLHAVTNSLILP